jgi:hypothetical protein
MQLALISHLSLLLPVRGLGKVSMSSLGIVGVENANSNTCRDKYCYGREGNGENYRGKVEQEL